MNESAEIRRLVVTLASGESPTPECCRDWTKAHVEAVRRHQLGPWLHFRLRDFHEAGLSDEAFRILEKDYGLSSIVSRLRAVSMKSVLEALERSEIPVVILKGAYLAQAVYEDPGLRTMCDVDLLTREEDFERARHELTGLGYVVASEALYEDRLLPPVAMALIKPGEPHGSIDLHRALRGIDYYLLSSSDAWDRAVENRLYAHRVHFLTPELNFIHLAMHTLNHPYLLRNWLDLVLLSGGTRLDWDRVCESAQALGVVRPVYWAVEELRSSWDVPVPHRVTARLSSYVPGWLEDRVIDGRFRYAWRLWAKLGLVKGWGPRLAYVRSKVFPPAAYREAFSGDPRWSSYWVALLRHVAKRITDG